MAGYIGNKSAVVSSGAERKKTFAITTTTTSLTGLSYTPNFVHVFHNGIRLVDGTDYTATNGTSITLTNAAENGDEVVVVSYGTFTPADAYTKAEADDRYVNVAGDTMTGGLTVSAPDTNNILKLERTGSSSGSGYIYANANETFGVHNGSGAYQLMVDSSGRVTTPYQPMFSAFNLATAAQYPITYSTWATFDSNLSNFDSTKYAVGTNVGSHFSTSNGRFTAPVAGRYLISVNVGLWVGNTSYIVLFKNGAYTAPYQLVYNADLGAYQNMTLNQVVTLAAGDYVQPGFYASSGGPGGTYVPGGGYLQFSGFLIG